MRDINKLLDNVKETRSLASDTALAGFLHVTRQAVSNWRKGHSLPDIKATARIADALGEPVNRVLGEIGEARAIDREEKAVWRRIASAAAIVAMCGVLSAFSKPVSASPDAGSFSRNSAYAVYYVSIRRWLNAARRALESFATTRRPLWT
jgi:transcriptional regulator with XRE-family HTH domain